MPVDLYRTPVQFQRATITKNPFGEPIPIFEDAFKLGCEVRQYASQRSFENRQAEVSGDAIYITVRLNQNTRMVDTSYCANINGKSFRIVGVETFRAQRNTIRFLADIMEAG